MPHHTRRHYGRAPRLRRAASCSLGLLAIGSLLLLGACVQQQAGPCGPGDGPLQRYFYQPMTTPVVGNGVVYIGYGSGINRNQTRLAAFRANDDTQLWQRPDPVHALIWPNPERPDGGPTLALAGDTLLVFSGSSEIDSGITSTLAALRAGDGTLLWQVPRSISWRASPVVQDGILYTFDAAGLYAVRLTDGQVLWSVYPPSHQYSAPARRAAVNGLRNFGPVVAGGVVYMGWVNGPIMAVRASDGTLLWQVGPPSAGQQRFFEPDPVAVVGGVLYVRMGEDLADAVLLVRTRDGHVLGRIHTQPTAGTGTPSIAETPSTPGTAGGAEKIVGYDFEPAVIGGTLYLGVSEATQAFPGSKVHFLYLLETLDGQQLWQVPATGASSTTFAPAHLVAQDDGVVFLASVEVFAVRMAGGVVLWRNTVKSDITFLAAEGGALYESMFGLYDACAAEEYSAPGLQALNATSRHVVWTRTFPITGS